MALLFFLHYSLVSITSSYYHSTMPLTRKSKSKSTGKRRSYVFSVLTYVLAIVCSFFTLSIGPPHLPLTCIMRMIPGSFRLG